MNTKKAIDFKSCSTSILFILVFLWGLVPAPIAAFMLFDDTFYKLKLALYYEELMAYDLAVTEGRFVSRSIKGRSSRFYQVQGTINELDTFQVKLDLIRGEAIFGPSPSSPPYPTVKPRWASTIRVYANLQHGLIEVRKPNGEINSRRSIFTFLLFILIMLYLPPLFSIGYLVWTRKKRVD